jgi:dipeptidyl aminopeptidase/acylaminoacyl peptidase
MVVLVHGGPHGIWDRWGWDPVDPYRNGTQPEEVQLLAHHGYAVLQVNFRGSGGFGTRFLTAGYRHWGTTMQDDLTDAVGWAVGKGIADPKRLCIMGASYGGYAALMSAQREPDLYKCAVGYVGVYDVGLLFTDSDTAKSASGRRALDRFHGTESAEHRAHSPAAFADRIKADLMLAAGKRDRRVSFSHYEAMSEALRKAGKGFESVVQAKEGHGFADVENRVDLYTKILVFLQRNIGGADTRVAAPDPGPAKK